MWGGEVEEAPLLPGETICSDCRLAFNPHLGACSNCDFWSGTERQSENLFQSNERAVRMFHTRLMRTQAA